MGGGGTGRFHIWSSRGSYKQEAHGPGGRGEGVTDIATFEGLVAGHQAEIYAYILRMVRHDGEAQDLCQETFLRAYRAFGGLQGEPNYRAWLYRIATNTTLNALRQRRSGERAIETLAASQPVATVDEQVEDLERRTLLTRIEAAIHELPMKQRIAFTQRRFAGLSYAEIAECLGTTEEAARANVYQAVRKLRAQFSAELSEVGL